jgi:hypothetical protein
VARRAFEAELKARDVHLLERGQAAARVDVTVSHSLQGGLLVAEIESGGKRTVAMVTFDRPPAFALSPGATEIALHRQLLWEQEEPVLDAVFLHPSSPDTMFLLEPARVTRYRRDGKQWRLEQVFPLPRSKPGLRDLFGHLAASPERIDAVSSDDSCSIDPHLSVRIVCQTVRPEALPPPGETVVDGKKTPPAYAHVVLEANGESLQVIAGNDGVTRLYEDGPEAVATFAGWGSELAKLRSGCGPGEQLLTTRAGDWTEPEAVTAYEIVDRQAVAVAAAAEFPGPVMVLRSAVDLQTAVAIVRNLKTGHYEVYRLYISCTR